MAESSIPSYSFLILVVVVIANLATAWVVMLTMGENNRSLYAAGPPGLAALSVFAIVLYQYDIIVSQEVTFWGSAILAALGLWGAWVDYAHLSDRRKALEKAAFERKKKY